MYCISNVGCVTERRDVHDATVSLDGNISNNHILGTGVRSHGQVRSTLPSYNVKERNERKRERKNNVNVKRLTFMMLSSKTMSQIFYSPHF